LTDLLWILGTSLGLFVAFRQLFWWANDAIAEEKRAAFGNWFKNASLSEISREWHIVFNGMFDAIFHDKHFSLRCFWRSCIASALAFMFSYFLVTSLSSGGGTHTHYQHLNYASLSLSFIVVIILNSVADYVSLYETRKITGIMNQNNKLFCLVLDFVFTFSVVLVAFWIFANAATLLLGRVLEVSLYQAAAQIAETFVIFAQGALSGDGSPLLPMAVISTYFTSVWVWLFAWSLWVIKWASFSWVQNYFDTNNPFRAIGLVAGTTAAVLWLLVSGGFMLLRLSI